MRVSIRKLLKYSYEEKWCVFQKHTTFQMGSSELCQGLDFLTSGNVPSSLTLDDLETLLRSAEAENIIGVHFKDTRQLTSMKTIGSHFKAAQFFNTTCPWTMTFFDTVNV